MIILVSDTSVLIDLERGGLLEPAFSCGLPMVVPDLLYARELEADTGPFLRTLGLGVVALVRIPLIADTHSSLIADSVPGDRGQAE